MGIGFTELLVILLIAFFIFGAKRLPELGAGLGKAIRSFNRGIKGEEEKNPDGKDKKQSD
jgi:sec-independent protein translocase protein TatA